MSRLSRNHDVVPTDSAVEFADLDHVPLAIRRISLLSSRKVHGVSQTATATALASKVDNTVKREDDCCNMLELSSKQNGNYVVSSGIAPESAVSELGWSQDTGEPGNQKSQNSTLTGLNLERDSDGVGNAEGCITDDHLELISLKERQRMLLGRMTLRLAKPIVEENSVLPSNGHGESNPYKTNVEVSCENGIASFAGSQVSGILEKNEPVLRKNFNTVSVSGRQFGGMLERISSNLRKGLPIASSNGNLSKFSSIDYEYSPGESECYAATAKKPSTSVEKVKKIAPVPASDAPFSTPQNYVQIKIEPLDSYPVQNMEKKSSCNLYFEQAHVKREVESPHDVYENELDHAKLCYQVNQPTLAQNPLFSDEKARVKREVETAHEVDEEELDHMTLSDRMKLPKSGQNSLNSCSLGEDKPSNSEFSSVTSDYAKPFRMHRPRKRKKTITDSVETALEEDAPGLLQVLLRQGVLVNEMKLYGETECDEDLNKSLMEESFSELEAVMSKLLFKRESYIKLLPVRCMKDSRPTYCLTCLLSLVEQARYLQFRKWPVEWGWSRELQSFIFVFERHKRIVMERPEYGYATYFFELVDTSPIDWQIKRLVIAMKLTSCGRITLIENKPLLVGEDLTEEEAQVLMEYGWVPNTGLGTMLNYCDRVVHDRKSEKDTSEWRSKICKLLVDGYSNGIVISTILAETETRADFRDYGDTPQVKQEFY